MLLILLLVLLFCPSLAEEELRGVKHKYADSDQAYYTICNSIYVHDKEKVRPFHFDKRPIPKFHSFASAIPIMILLPHR